MTSIITLTTDFGLADEYVAVMKGVILGRAPDATIIDLSHGIARQNIRQAALLIASAYKFFPDRTVHIVVVDPGVGGSRRLILLQAHGHLFLAPDNGVLGLLLEPEHFQAAYELQCEQYYVQPVSSTFHGRDILAPVAARLAKGLDPAAVGPAIARQVIKTIAATEVNIDQKQHIITGEIAAIDHFGNLLTNISAECLQDLYGSEKSFVTITVNGRTITGIHGSYMRKAPGELLAVIGSRGFLEIAVNQGSAASYLAARLADKVRVEKSRA
ncbi:MAG: SAM-dependent chlorinase/fluorinase [Desulfobulbales bacterium]|nr:SAM-dependent chlorinase/fluorinase [Desulfobulbales bacterium]